MSLRRLQAAGLIAEPGMRAAWATGDPVRVKAWVEGKARKLRKARRRR